MHPAFSCCNTLASDSLNIGSLLALRARRHFERDLLTLLKRLEARHVDCREMRKQIFAPAVRRYEAEAFSVVEPLYRSSCHVYQSSKQKNNRDEPGQCFDLKDRKERL